MVPPEERRPTGRPGGALSADRWIARFSAALDVPPPSPEEVAALLRVASVAAHASERMAAPLACWLVARAGAAPDRALRLAEGLEPSSGSDEAS